MLNSMFWLGWVAWSGNVFDNWTILTFMLHAYVGLNCLKWSCFLTLKLYLHWTELFGVELFWHLAVCGRDLYLCWTELHELELLDWTEYLAIEMFFTIKPYLHLNCILMLGWIVWNWTVFDIETVLTLNWIVIYNCLNKLSGLKWKCFWQLNCVLMLN